MAEEKFDAISEIQNNRNGLYEALKDVTTLRSRVKDLLPAGTNMDYKNRYMLEGKLKTISDIIGNELSVRKAINDSIKLQTDIVRKDKQDEREEEMDQATIRAMAREFDKIEKEDAAKSKAEEDH